MKAEQTKEARFQKQNFKIKLSKTTDHKKKSNDQK